MVTQLKQLESQATLILPDCQTKNADVGSIFIQFGFYGTSSSFIMDHTS